MGRWLMVKIQRLRMFEGNRHWFGRDWPHGGNLGRGLGIGNQDITRGARLALRLRVEVDVLIVVLFTRARWSLKRPLMGLGLQQVQILNTWVKGSLRTHFIEVKRG